MPVMPPSARLAALRNLQLILEGRMPEHAPRATIPPTVTGKMLCPKCGATMNLARRMRVPSGFYIRTFDCTGCDHAHIVTIADNFPGGSAVRLAWRWMRSGKPGRCNRAWNQATPTKKWDSCVELPTIRA
jgi:hypothetical protein